MENKMYQRDYWIQESPVYREPHYRLLKCSKVINALSQGKNCDLLDVGCGPATLSKFLNKNLNYYGIDGNISEPKPNLIEKNLAEQKVEFGDKSFDIICAFGFFEYIGDLQRQKLEEIHQILMPEGKFLTSFINLQHRHPMLIPAYNNVIPIQEFVNDLRSFFRINRMYPTSYNWVGTEPQRDWLQKIQLPLRLNIPFFNNFLAVEYIFICSKE